MESLKKFYEKFVMIPGDFYEAESRKNRNIVKIIFMVSVFFGGFFLSLSFFLNLFFKFQLRANPYTYYSYFLLVGVLGLLLLKTRLPSSFFILLVLILSEYVITVNLLKAPFSSSVVIFIGFFFAFIMVLNMNPVMFTIQLILYICFIEVFKACAHIQMQYPDSTSFIKNVFLFMLVIIFLSFWKRKYIIESLLRDARLEKERKKADELLHNILPDSVIQQLKVDGKSPPKNYENISLLVADIVDFTKTATDLPPYVLILELNEIFSEYDRICELHKCIRIKTIGDAYMAVCGLPEEDPEHAENIMNCAKDFIACLDERNKKSQIKWNIRVGIASGSAIAGIIGKKKYLYDILGETVDTAVKLQNSCQPMHIRISEKTYQLLKEKEAFDPVELGEVYV
ncbi:hypothetical protein MSI_05420 [Treponema sp. JC4]|uniref:adenylate/guanylate cyclase domain-containing protein n=1 Tax=Treponema sp. JC4 TaxID=1124982 RepID=UPI00025B0A13|nr:adenylate/guanylate cyclase domain-containing protein [Treponema sp. JC4]EID85723.1 hypothetical protein MSI_05420 [Treponema sp. JC4]